MSPSSSRSTSGSTPSTASARRLLGELAPPILGAIALLVLIQVPLVWSLIRGLQRGSEEREALLANAIGASNRERRRVAAYLHDGPVQDIAGVAFSLAPRRRSGAGAGGEVDEASVLSAAIDNLRHSVRDLRALLVDLHPPHLQAAGLEAALRDLLSPLEARGIETELSVVGLEHIDQAQEALVYRAAQEALRNVVDHAQATRASVTVSRRAGRHAARRHRRRPRLHAGAARAARGRGPSRAVAARGAGAPIGRGADGSAPSPGDGTTVELEVPQR